MKKIAVLASGFGSNLEAIIRAVKTKKIRGAEIALVFSDCVDAFALARARKHNIPILYLDPQDFKRREDFDRCVVAALKKKKIDLVVLAGFMRIISPYFVRQFRNRIMNVHPALLPSFKGASGISEAYDYGVKITGVTVHFVDEQMDHGPIIIQAAVDIKEGYSVADLEQRIHALEHRLLPQAIELFVSGRLRVCGRKVKIKDKDG